MKKQEGRISEALRGSMANPHDNDSEPEKAKWKQPAKIDKGNLRNTLD